MGTCGFELHSLTTSASNSPAFAAMRVHALRKNWFLSLIVLMLLSVSGALNFVSPRFLKLAIQVLAPSS